MKTRNEYEKAQELQILQKSQSTAPNSEKLRELAQEDSNKNIPENQEQDCDCIDNPLVLHVLSKVIKAKRIGHVTWETCDQFLIMYLGGHHDRHKLKDEECEGALRLWNSIKGLVEIERIRALKEYIPDDKKMGGRMS